LLCASRSNARRLKAGRTERGNEEAARAAGMNFYFAKPVSPGKLAEALMRLTR
jgi:CheY-like chemotaxis protein